MTFLYANHALELKILGDLRVISLERFELLHDSLVVVFETSLQQIILLGCHCRSGPALISKQDLEFARLLQLSLNHLVSLVLPLEGGLVTSLQGSETILLAVIQSHVHFIGLDSWTRDAFVCLHVQLLE